MYGGKSLHDVDVHISLLQVRDQPIWRTHEELHRIEELDAANGETDVMLKIVCNYVDPRVLAGDRLHQEMAIVASQILGEHRQFILWSVDTVE